MLLAGEVHSALGVHVAGTLPASLARSGSLLQLECTYLYRGAAVREQAVHRVPRAHVSRGSRYAVLWGSCQPLRQISLELRHAVFS